MLACVSGADGERGGKSKSSSLTNILKNEMCTNRITPLIYTFRPKPAVTDV